MKYINLSYLALTGIIALALPFSASASGGQCTSKTINGETARHCQNDIICECYYGKRRTWIADLPASGSCADVAQTCNNGQKLRKIRATDEEAKELAGDDGHYSPKLSFSEKECPSNVCMQTFLKGPSIESTGTHPNCYYRTAELGCIQRTNSGSKGTYGILSEGIDINQVEELFGGL